MRKFLVLLLGITMASSVYAVSYTAKAKLTLTSADSYTCDLMLSESGEYGALDGSVMNMEDRVVALYVLKGSTKLQIARTSDFTEVKVGLLTNSSTSYTIDVSEVEGSETLRLYDSETGEVHPLTLGASFSFTATASSTIEDRFVLKVPVDTDPLETCFTGTELQIKSNPYYGKITVKTSGGSTVKQYAYGTSSINFNETDGGGDYIYSNNTEYTVSFGTSRSFIVKVKR